MTSFCTVSGQHFAMITQMQKGLWGENNISCGMTADNKKLQENQPGYCSLISGPKKKEKKTTNVFAQNLWSIKSFWLMNVSLCFYVFLPLQKISHTGLNSHVLNLQHFGLPHFMNSNRHSFPQNSQNYYRAHELPSTSSEGVSCSPSGMQSGVSLTQGKWRPCLA